MAYDLITMGRIGVDLYPLQTGVPLPQVTSFGKFLGGSATNVAVAAARLGRRTAVITRTGDDPFGTYLHEALKGFGVDDRWVTPVPGLPTPRESQGMTRATDPAPRRPKNRPPRASDSEAMHRPAW